MPRLTLGRDFFADYHKLSRDVQKKVADLLPKFELETRAGVHLEKPEGSADPRARTVRVDRFWRGVVIAPEYGDDYILVKVLPHDDAYAWCQRHRFTVNETTGALEVLDVPARAAAVSALTGTEAGPVRAADKLFSRRGDREFKQLGIPEDLLPVLRLLERDEELIALASALPPGQGEALQMLASGYTVEEAYRELVAGGRPGPFDPDDLAAAVTRPASGGMFYVVESPRELADALKQPLELWRVFLHPSQRRLVGRPVFNGPVRVTGGAGTGKTVVAVHRARRLADSLPAGAHRRVLLTTFTSALAEDLRDRLVSLAGEAILGRVMVTHLDALAFDVVRDGEGSRPSALDDGQAAKLWRLACQSLSLPSALPWTVVRNEWQHVILAQGITDRDAYFAASRRGTGVRLDRRHKALVWDAVNRFKGMRGGLRTFHEIADSAARHLAVRKRPPFDHVVVDEAQDLHPAQWRMLRAAVAEGPNDLFLVGDAHQRIYDSRVSLSSLGISIVGRSFRLRVNYRTTEEILRWALRLLQGTRIDDLDDGIDSTGGYRSETRGPQPTIAGYDTRSEELAGLVDAVRSWLARGVLPAEIGVAARTNAACGRAEEALNAAVIPTGLPGTGPHVTVCTMHRMKGLEYRCVAVIDVSAASVPHRLAVTPATEDPVSSERDLLRERCLVYVACTRAREDLRVSWGGMPSSFLASLQ